jgi:hypothetical protein
VLLRWSAGALGLMPWSDGGDGAMVRPRELWWAVADEVVNRNVLSRGVEQ